MADSEKSDLNEASGKPNAGASVNDAATADKSSTVSDEEAQQDEDVAAEAKYKVFDKVFARDDDGVMYEAIIRRALYGPTFHSQVQVGMAASAEEAADLMEQSKSKEEPSWHYFVHFNGWNVKWDRWVPEDAILVVTPATQEYVNLIRREHAALKKTLTRKLAGRKASQSINAATFLREWRKKLDKINREHANLYLYGASSNTDDAASSPSKTGESKKRAKGKRSGEWTKGAIEKEISLRSKSLTKKRSTEEASTISLPFTLKKVLVEQWEIINQCNMVVAVPTKVSIRQALDLYLESKGVVAPIPPTVKGSKQGPKKEDTKDTGKESESNEQPQQDANTNDRSDTFTPAREIPADAKSLVTKPEENLTEKVLPKEDTMEIDSEKSLDQPTTRKTPSTSEKAATLEEQREKEWIDMAEGIALLFDEALPNTLLYEAEGPQLTALDSMPDLSEKRYSELYGCEHLLRLFVRLPPLLVDSMPDEDERRPILAKVNDLVRFIQKNQTTLLAQTYRKPTALEREEAQKLLKKMEAATRKRKRAAEALVTDEEPYVIPENAP